MVESWQGKARRVPLLLVISWLAVAAPAYADEINITPLERLVAAGGRGIVTLRFEVENRSGQPHDWVEQLGLPTGWERISSPAPFTLSAGARDVRLIHVSIPGGTASGTFPVRYSVSARDNGSIGGTETISVKVESVAGAELTVLDSPSSLLAGEPYTAQFQLKNTGNQPVTYALSVQDEDGYVTAITPKTLTLPAGDMGTVDVQGQIPTALDDSGAHKITLRAKGGGRTAEQSITIPTIARTSKGLGKYQQLSGELKLSYSGQKNSGNNNNLQNGGQWQADYHASGALDEDGKHNIELHARNGQAANNTNNQLQSEYQATYWDDEWRVKAGDNSFYTGRLSGNGVTGLGAEVTYTPKISKDGQAENTHKPLEIRAFSGQSRTGVGVGVTEKEKAAGAVVNYRFDEPNVEVGASILNYQKQGKPKNTITGASAGWNGDNFTVRGEFAKDKHATAQAVDLTANWEDISGNLSYQKAAPTFEGANQDTQASYGGVNWKIDDNSRLDVTARKSKSNLAADLTKEIRDDREQQVRLSHTFGDQHDIEVTAGYRTRTEKDLRVASTTNRTVKAGSLEYRQSIDEALDLSALWEQGKRTDKIKPSGSGSKQELAAKWHPEPDWDVGTTYTRNRNLESDGNSTSFGANGHYRFGQRRDFSGYLQRTKNNGDGSRSDSYQITYNHGLKRRSSINLSGTRTRSQPATGTSTNDTLWRVEYVMPLDIPIRRRTNIGSLGGFAYYADTDEPAKDIVLNLDGQYAVTDAEGKYFYPDIAAKEYQLQIDPIHTNEANYMLGDEGSTRAIKVEAGKKIQVDLPLQPGASLAGSVRLFTTDKASVLGKGTAKASVIAGDGLGGILLELQPVGEVGNRTIQKRISEGDGSFSFYGIAPGQWQLVVVDTDKMPEHARLEQAQFTVDLLEGDTQELTVRVLPMEQTIQKTGPTGGFQVSG